MLPVLWAVSDLHVHFDDNRDVVTSLRSVTDEDWLIVAGDVGELLADVAWAFGVLTERFRIVIWVPGNHELWTMRRDPDRVRGVQRYERLVELAREHGVHTPEDPYPVWRGSGGSVVVAPLFTLYDYSFLPAGLTTKAMAMARAERTGVICTDELFLHSDPYATREEWCRARVAATAARLDAIDPAVHTVLVNHWPLIQTSTRMLRYPEFAQWCGTVETARWHTRYRAKVVVYGHLHIPRTTWHDGVRFEEVSLGYPREWLARPAPPRLRPIFPQEPLP